MTDLRTLSLRLRADKLLSEARALHSLAADLFRQAKEIEERINTDEVRARLEAEAVLRALCWVPVVHRMGRTAEEVGAPQIKIGKTYWMPEWCGVGFWRTGASSYRNFLEGVAGEPIPASRNEKIFRDLSRRWDRRGVTPCRTFRLAVELANLEVSFKEKT